MWFFVDSEVTGLECRKIRSWKLILFEMGLHLFGKYRKIRQYKRRFEPQRSGNFQIEVYIRMKYERVRKKRGGVQPHRHSKIGLWGWGKMGINGEKWGNLETCKILFRRNNKPFIEFNQLSKLFRTILFYTINTSSKYYCVYCLLIW